MDINTIEELVKIEINKWKQKFLSAKSTEEYVNIQTEKIRHFRLLFEPYIFNYLIYNYGKQLDEFWQSYLPPKKAEKTFILVERRPHPNFWFVLRNIAWAAPDFSVHIFCSDENINFIKALLGDKVDNFNLIQAFSGSPPLDIAIREYNHFLINHKMYDAIDAEWGLLVQMDVFIRKKIPNEIFIGEYWGYPFGWNPKYAGGGGATVRNIKKLADLCRKYEPNAPFEDVWFCEKMIETNAEVPSFEFRQKYFMENVPSLDPCVVHQFWTYIDSYLPFLERNAFKIYWSHILTISI